MVQIIEHEEFDAHCAHVIAAFPCVGLVATITANFLIEEMGLKEVGIVDGEGFPSLCVVEDGVPKNPVRMYHGQYKVKGEAKNLVVFLSEFQPDPTLIRPVAEAILGWCKERGAELIVSAEGIVLEGEAALDDIVEVYSVGSTDRARKLLDQSTAPRFKDGIVAGVTGILLTLGKRDHFDVIGILSEAKQEYPDVRSAATVIEVLANMVGVEADVSRLYKEADGFEAHVKDVAAKKRRHQEQAARSRELMFI
ncbi:MAG: proteasome assembly chaperone family protein [Thermoplasmatota archaeon]